MLPDGGIGCVCSFLSRTQTERVAIKLPKLDKMIMKENGLVSWVGFCWSEGIFEGVLSLGSDIVEPLIRDAGCLQPACLFKGLYAFTINSESICSACEENARTDSSVQGITHRHWCDGILKLLLNTTQICEQVSNLSKQSYANQCIRKLVSSNSMFFFLQVQWDLFWSRMM